MAFEILVGLLVADQDKYAAYRAEMTPLLQAAGGQFRYDFEVARTLKGEAGHSINRVFILQFPDRQARDRFFSDPQYLEIRHRWFDSAVDGTTIIAEYTS